ncbi:4-alpha-glucanotransferase [Dyella humi]|uniref:4-alpha-glucanotransferase n=1 Tax=Dyella humi TaxID=1770547 RepID=A0ABW8IL62_9GAMM
MSDFSLETLARAAGISVQWTDAYGQARSLSDDALHGLLDTMKLPAHDAASRQTSLRLIEERDHARPSLVTVDVGDAFDLPSFARGATSITAYDEEGRAQTLPLLGDGQCQAPAHYGYYQLDIGNQPLMLAVAPQRCFSVGDCLELQTLRAWGLSAQVYSLRHPNDGGVGDSRAVAELTATIGRAGGDALALSPLHAISPVAGHYSPYSPSHRGFLNWLHADPAQILGAPALDAAIHRSGIASTGQHAQQGKLVDWPVVYALRRNLFRILHQQFAQAPQGLRNDLERFIAEGGDALSRHARLAARQSQAVMRGESTSWKTWQENWHNEATANAFAQSHPTAVDFEIFLQWLAARCWEKTCRVARDAGQRIGLIWDLAVGFEAGGGEAWAWREHVLEGLELGAPPDAFNPTGQSWGITSYSPWGLKASGFRPFIELLRANMARGGGIRIDHIIGFQHLWVLPKGRPSTEGGYVHQPLQDLLRLTALESWRQQCIVIGEDLGTVPEGLRDVLAARGVLGIDVLLFTRDKNGDFLAPGQWRKNAVAMTTTHDLPPLMGWREGLDIEQLAKAHGWDDGKLQQSMQARKKDVARLDEALTIASPSFRRRPESSLNTRPEDTKSVLSASHDVSGLDSGLRRNDGEAIQAATQTCNSYVEYLIQTPSPLILIPLEDALARKEQPNLPGTVDSHPNWQHRLPDDAIDQLQPLLQSIGTSLKEAMPA